MKHQAPGIHRHGTSSSTVSSARSSSRSALCQWRAQAPSAAAKETQSTSFERREMALMMRLWCLGCFR